ncbi:MAG: DUF481 domain-containing protein [Gammaproteobacteria bacterium]|nr:DUF481 domain-containing protein [Gammaproteobacteria bacterium]MBU2058705.1 DUF481 domain-containing protein [Gammaproteobacteria bacterium]MBU2177174.1 DUF481 domain-containing protein [Gammaproteobacteria bacterium]MBU2246409.1 DUF481 domain-containing protein [Gammaproteobacteria bacterium]MBU2342604.1 DUF481 domain-containing protein [Gammaproteobacteria bacterium]
MAKLHFFYAATLGASAFLSSPLTAQTIDIDYLKTTNPELYQQLMAVELCRKEPENSSCQAALPKKSVAVAPEQHTKAAPEAQKPRGKWWYDSAYDQDGLNDQWQHAVQVTVDLEEMSGNLDGEQFHVEVDYFSRINTWTNYLTLIYEKDDVKQSGVVALDKKHYAFNYGGRYDFNQTWYGQGGYIIEQDTSQSLDRQQVFYAGAGLHLVGTDKVNLSTMLALGKQQDKFINAEAVGIDSLDYSVAYFVEQLSWHISQSISINQSISWLHSLESLPEVGSSTLSGGGPNPQCLTAAVPGSAYCIVDNGSKSKLELMLGLEYQINAYISLLYNFSYEKDNMPWAGVEGTDKTNNLSIRASFQ